MFKKMIEKMTKKNDTSVNDIEVFTENLIASNQAKLDAWKQMMTK